MYTTKLIIVSSTCELNESIEIGHFGYDLYKVRKMINNHISHIIST